MAYLAGIVLLGRDVNYFLHDSANVSVSVVGLACQAGICGPWRGFQAVHPSRCLGVACEVREMVQMRRRTRLTLTTAYDPEPRVCR